MHMEFLESIPLFAGLNGDEKWDLAQRITIRDLPAREALFWIGDTGDEFFVIVSGRVEITYPDENGREVTLAVLGKGDFIGEVSLLDGGPRTATVRAQTDVTLLCLGREAFQHFIRQTPVVAIHILKVLGRRQREYVDKLRGIRNLNEVMAERLTTWERVANSIAALAACRGFLVAHAIGFVGWVAMNLWLGSGAFDPYPFQFLCLWSSTEAIFLSLFILISQNLQSQKDRMRTELEYQVALKAQFEIMQLHRKLDELPDRLRNEIRDDDDVDDRREQPVGAVG